MPRQWAGSTRRSRLPRDWSARRAAVKARAGGRCEQVTELGHRCAETGTDCDHIVAGDNHDLANLAWLCPWHHQAKSSSEGGSAAARRQRMLRPPQAAHPGLR